MQRPERLVEWIDQSVLKSDNNKNLITKVMKH